MEYTSVSKIIEKASKIPFEGWDKSESHDFGGRDYSATLKKGFKIGIYTRWYSSDKNKPWLGDPIYGLRIIKKGFIPYEIFKIESGLIYPYFLNLMKKKKGEDIRG